MKNKFKNLFWSLVCFSTAVTCAYCDEAKSRSFKITVEVKEESGSPVSDAQVTASKVILIQEKPLPVGEPVRVTEKTDARGIVGMLLESFNEPGGVSVSKSGYYTTTGSANWTQGKTDLEYSAFLPIVLKPIKKPIPLIARNNLRPRLPEFGVRYGFDLEKGESLPPLGNGRVADIEFTLSGHRIEHPDPNKEVIDFKVEISCPNEGDGFIEFLAVDTQEFSHGSDLVSAHEVPQGEFSRIITRTLSNGRTARLDASSATNKKRVSSAAISVSAPKRTVTVTFFRPITEKCMVLWKSVPR